MTEADIEKLIAELESVTDEGSCGVAQRAADAIRKLQHDLNEAVGYKLAAREIPKGEWD